MALTLVLTFALTLVLTLVLTPPGAGAGAALLAGAPQPPAALRQPLSSAEVSQRSRCHLSWSLCSRVETAAFHNNLELRVVDLSSNPRLRDLAPFAFPRLLRLSQLSLAGSSLAALRRDAAPWASLHYLDLGLVWLGCGCEAAWMLGLPLHGARCSAPPSLRSV